MTWSPYSVVMEISTMRQKLTLAAILAGFTGGLLLLAQSLRAADVQFKAAQHKEEVEGDLKGAIEQYKKIAQSGDRTLAAKALVALGHCYEKLGQNDARNAYERSEERRVGKECRSRWS